jgi:hypothetical protein
MSHRSFVCANGIELALTNSLNCCFNFFTPPKAIDGRPTVTQHCRFRWLTQFPLSFSIPYQNTQRRRSLHAHPELDLPGSSIIIVNSRQISEYDINALQTIRVRLRIVFNGSLH